MERDYWLNKWKNDQISFHETQPHALLVDHWDDLEVTPGQRVFVPLCGKTRDIHWFLDKGFQVAAIELSEIAVKQLFHELGITPEITKQEKLTCYRANQLDVFIGDIFDLLPDTLGHVDAIYDRAALVALPRMQRERYSAHLRLLTDIVPQLLITFTYDQTRLDGPPFSIQDDELTQDYEPHYTRRLLESRPLEGGLKGQCPATENAWQLQPNAAGAGDHMIP